MASVYYKFKSAKDFSSMPIDGHFITVGDLKEKIFVAKELGSGTDIDLMITNAQTNEEYLDESTLIPKHTAVLIRRVAGFRRNRNRNRTPVVRAPVLEQQKVKVEFQTVKDNGFSGAGANPKDDSAQDDEDSRIKALVETPALDWGNCQYTGGFGRGRGGGPGRGMGGRTTGMERKTPYPGYICRRCEVPGHFIQHCPTNGDPSYDIKRVKPPTGFPNSMLVAKEDGSYVLQSGAVAVLEPDEGAFKKEIGGLPAITRPVCDLPPELHCPLCEQVMKYAVLTSKCCFRSFCDKCIREYVVSKRVCVCGATHVLADDLIPNKTVRDTINRILESKSMSKSSNSSANTGGNKFQVSDVGSCNLQPKAPSLAQSAASKADKVIPPPAQGGESSKMQEIVQEAKAAGGDAFESTHESVSAKERGSQGSTNPLADEEVQQKQEVSCEAGKKKRKKKAQFPLDGVAGAEAEMQWTAAQGLESYMMPYIPYWAGMQTGMDAFMAPYPGFVPYMGFGLNPLDAQFGGFVPQDPFGGQGYTSPFAPTHGFSVEFGMGFNAESPQMSNCHHHPHHAFDDGHYCDQSYSSSSKSHHSSESAASSCISFPMEDQAASKKRKLSNSTEAPARGSRRHGGNSSNGYYEDCNAASSTTRNRFAPCAVDYESRNMFSRQMGRTVEHRVR